MAEQVAIVLGNDDAFDTIVRGGLPECGDLTIVTKDHATVEHRAGAVIAFSVRLPDGSIKAVQATTTVRNLVFALAALRGRYGDDGIVRTFDKVN